MGPQEAPAGVRPTVVVTRPRAKASSLVDGLRERGFGVILAPSIRIVPPADPEPLRRAVARLDRFDWVVLTSASGAEAVARARKKAGVPRRTPRRLAVVGSSTARAAERLGWTVDLVPDRYTGEALLAALEREVTPLRGTTMLLPLAETARELLPRGLEARGVRVTRVTAYRTIPDDEAAAPLLEALGRGEVDLLTFTSPSTAERFLEAVGSPALEVPAVVIGPVTADAAEGLGFRVAAVAGEHTIGGLMAAVEEVVARRGAES